MEEELTEKNKIFRTLMHFPGSSFTDLWDKQLPSNKFTYYLKKMEEEKLIEKRKGKYFLTLKGKKASTTISGETGKNKKRPYFALLLVIRKNGKYVLYKRMKEPYYGVSGFPGAKVELGEEILESAKRELLEETGLEGEPSVLTVQNVITENNGEVFGHMIQIAVLFDEPRGELIKSSREGTYNWATKEEILKAKNLFPDVPIAMQEAERNSFSIKEIKLIQKNEKFTDMIVNEIK